MRFFVVVACLVCLAWPLSAQADPDAFDRDYAAVLEQVEQGRWAKVDTLLRALIEQHAGQDYVLRKREEIVETMRRCAFWKDRDPLKERDLISGKLTKYVREKGTMNLEYDERNLQDFVRVKITKQSELLYHPLTFNGQYSIEIEGSRYPQVVWGRNPGASWILDIPSVVVGYRPDRREGYWVSLGQKRAVVGSGLASVPAFINYRTPDDVKTCDEVDPTPVQPNKPYKIKITVNKSVIKAYYNGKLIMRTKKEAPYWGTFAIVGFNNKHLESIEVRGRSNAAWLQGLMDEALQDEWDAFDREFRLEDELPAWLLKTSGDEAESSEEEERGLELLWPEELSEPVQEQVDEFERVFLSEGPEKALRHLSMAGVKEALPSDLRDYLRFLACFSLGRYEEAERCGDRLWAARPDDIVLHRYRPILASVKDSRAHGVLEARALREDFPEAPESYVALIRSLVLAGRSAEAKEVMNEAMKAGVDTPELREINTLLVKSLDGPRWNKPHKQITSNYEVYSDLDMATCKRVAEQLELALKNYSKRVHPLPKDEKRRFRVYVFAGESGYLAYWRGLFDYEPVFTAGLYSPALKQLLLWNGPFRDELELTARHEGFHQYLDRLMEDPPFWFNEGMAEYFSLARQSSVDWKEGQMNVGRMPVLEANKDELVPLKEFLYQTAAEFQGEGVSLHYAQAWAFIHFLRHSTKEHRALFDDFFQAMLGTTRRRAALERVFGSVNWKKFEADFHAHVRGLL